MAARVIAPVQGLTDAVRRMRQGSLGEQLAIGGSPEFVELATAFNDMTLAIKHRDEVLQQNTADLQQALERAQEASRLKSEFLANVSHELRTPLNAIVNVPVALLAQYRELPVWQCPRCAGLFSSDQEGSQAEVCPACGCHMGVENCRTKIECIGEPAEQRHFLKRLLQSGQHLLHVVEDLLNFSKLEAGKMRLFPDQLNAKAVLAELESSIEPLATQKQITIETDIPEDHFTLVADGVKLAQILINLVGNAIKFTEPGGKVAIRIDAYAEGEKTWARFAVADTGMGIPKDKFAEIFESFRQVDNSHTRAHGGTGLGLAITKQLVELHGGRIWVDSELGTGSTFSFILPRTTAQAPPSGDAVELPVMSRPDDSAPTLATRIMIVDDSPEQLEVTRLVLEREGFVTELVQVASEAIGRIGVCAPSAVILDIMMPHVSGIEILKEIKANPQTRDVPVLVATAFHSNRELVQRLGGIWVPKPWSGPQLIEELTKCLVSAKSTRSLA